MNECSRRLADSSRGFAGGYVVFRATFQKHAARNTVAHPEAGCFDVRLFPLPQFIALALVTSEIKR